MGARKTGIEYAFLFGFIVIAVIIAPHSEKSPRRLQRCRLRLIGEQRPPPVSYSDSDMPDGADKADGTPSGRPYLRIATLIVWTLALFVLGMAVLADGAPTATHLVSALGLSALVVVGAAAHLKIAALTVWTLILWGVVLIAFAPEEEWDNFILAFTLVLSTLVAVGTAALIRRNWMLAAIALAFPAVVLFLFFGRHVPPGAGGEIDPVPGAPDGAYTLSSYSDAMAGWCGERSVESLARRFGVAPTAEDAARAVADEARAWRRDLFWFATFEGCWQGFTDK